MSCYIRHLTEVLRDLSMEDTRENRKELDRQIRKLLILENDDCPVVWNEVKMHIQDPFKREILIEEIRKTK